MPTGWDNDVPYFVCQPLRLSEEGGGVGLEENKCAELVIMFIMT